MRSSTIVTKTARIWLEDDGIVRVINLPRSETRLKEAIQNVHATEIFGDEKRPVFIDISRIKSASRGAREYFAGSEASKRTTVMAILVGSSTSRVIGNFFLGLNKPKYPIKLFCSEKKALDWLKSYDK